MTIFFFLTITSFEHALPFVFNEDSYEIKKKFVGRRERAEGVKKGNR